MDAPSPDKGRETLIDLAAIRAAFFDLTDIKPLGDISGQKDVFGARQNNHRVCLKIVKRYSGGGDRTEREIEAVVKLASDYVPAIYQHGAKAIGGEDRHYIIEQFIEGQTYRNVLKSTPVQPLQNVLELANSLLHACAEFERASLVHRDIKPENLILDPTGKVWVIDFGLARHLDKTSLTLTGQHFGVGTLGYAAPEQFRNIKPEIDSRADLFSIGVVLYEALNGTHPFALWPPDPIKTIRKMESEDLPLLAISQDNDGKFGHFIGQLVQRFPSRRPQSAAEALEWFRPIYTKMTTP
jgi:serine/threonine-protein kinase